MINKKATLAKNQQGEKVIQIEFPYDVETLTNIRTLPGRKWHAEQKCWSAPIFPETIKQLEEWGFTLDDTLLETLSTKKKEEKANVAKVPLKLKGNLYPFQMEGVAFIERNNGRALVADEMGLGKTVQALAWIEAHPKKRPVIIVVPASLKLNWAKEALTWLTKPNLEILMGTTPWKVTGDIIIINYDVLPAWVETLKRKRPQVLITDECHYYKSNKALRTKAVKKLGKGIPHVIALSGTPIVNKPIEAYNALRLIRPEIFSSSQYYIQRYCDPKWNGFGLDTSGASHTQELHELLTGTVMIRRLKRDVLPQLPPKVRSFVPVQLHNRGEYRDAEEDFIGFLRETKGAEAARRASNAEALAKIEALKQLSVQGKLAESIDWISDFLENGEKLVVFAVHRFVIDALMEKFSKIAVKIDGSVSLSERNKAVEAFQGNDKIRLFVGNIKAAGVGLTLTASSNVVFLELPWTPGDLSQAEDRCHRIGQKDSVNIYFLLAPDTIEERLAHILDSKRKVLDAVLDGEITAQESLLTELIKGYIS